MEPNFLLTVLMGQVTQKVPKMSQEWGVGDFKKIAILSYGLFLPEYETAYRPVTFWEKPDICEKSGLKYVLKKSKPTRIQDFLNSNISQTRWGMK